MKLSLKFLSDYVDIKDIPIKKFCDEMTMSGSKVEGYEHAFEELQNVVVCKILTVEPHPDSDHLLVCKVDAGNGKTLQIVTGAANTKAGELVPLALDGATLPGGKSIATGKLRGVLSEGMMCSLSELGLAKNDFPYGEDNGLFFIKEDCKPGDDIKQALGLDDIIVEFEITPNRPDCLAVMSMARETAVTFGRKAALKSPVVKGSGGKASDYISVEVHNPALCPRYIARVVTDVKIEPSPRWLRERLRASGIRPINNIVDITNFVMLEYGQPMHAFDLRHVDGAKIIVRNAQPGETITTLDDVKRELSPEMLVIADSQKPSAIAGVMGGEYSGIADDTRTIIFESANFNRASVRTTSRKLGLRTESSAHFEKGLQPTLCYDAVMRACELVEMLGAGKVVDEMVDIDNSSKAHAKIKFDPDWINGFLGTSIPAAKMQDILEALYFEIDEEGYVTPPAFRGDVSVKNDLAEEIARIYGYNNIPSAPLSGAAEGAFTTKQKFERKIVERLTASGLNEVVTYSFISPKLFDKANIPANSPLRKVVAISNPLGEETSIMRTYALPSILTVLSHNYNSRNQSAAIFEMATEYIPTTPDKLPEENPVITAAAYGEGCDYYTIKGYVEALLDAAGITDFEFVIQSADPTFHPGRCASLVIAGKTAGVLGELHPFVCENFELPARAYAMRVDFSALFDNRKAEAVYKHLPRFPAITRDLALICDESVQAAFIEKTIKAAAGAILESVELFDIYRGAQIPEGKKNVAYSLVLRSEEKTLTDADADAIIAAVLASLGENGITLR